MYSDDSTIDEQKQGILRRVERDPLACYGAIIGGDAASEFKRKGTEYYIRCPLHKDGIPSFRIQLRADKRGTWHCDPCSRGGDIFNLYAIINELDVKNDFPKITGDLAKLLANLDSDNPSPNDSERQIADTYDYRDERSGLLFQCVRYDPKEFRQRRPDGNGGWIWNLDDVRRVLYRLPELLAPSTEPIFLCEGEKDADALCDLGLIATTNPGGARKWRDEYSQTLCGRNVVILPDHDSAGEKHAAQVASALLSIARFVKVVRLPGLPDKGDVSDWLASGGTKEKLFHLVETTANFTAETVERKADSGGTSGFCFRTAAEYLSEVKMRSQKKPYWQGIIREGEVSLLLGRPFAGKSTFACALTLALHRGDTLLGRPCAQTRVAYLALERNGQNVAELFETWGIAGQVTFADETPAFKGDGSELADSLEREIRKRGLEVVIVDHLQNLMSVPDGNDYAKVSNAIAPLARIAKKTGAHLMLLHHQGKGAAREEIDAMGSEAYRGAADVLIEASKSGESHFIRTNIRGGDGNLPKTRVAVDLKTGEVTAVEASQVEFINNKKVVCDYVDAHGGEGVTIDTIQEETGIRRNTVLKILDEAVKGGLLTISGTGKRGDPRRYKSRSPSYTQNREPNLETPEVEETGVKEEKPFPNLKGNGGNGMAQYSKTQYPIGEIPFPRLETSLGTESDRDQSFTLGRSPQAPAFDTRAEELGN